MRKKLLRALLFPIIFLIWIIGWTLSWVGDRSEGKKRFGKKETGQHPQESQPKKEENLPPDE